MEENKNIFKGAKFPYIFILRCGLPAVFARKTEDSVEFIYQPRGTIYSGLTVYPNGQYSYYGEESELDVVGRYHKEIDEEKLDSMADVYEREYWKEVCKYTNDYGSNDIEEAYKAGYRKAKEE